MSPLILLAALVATYAGWQVFDDGPLAFYVSAGLLVCALLWQIRRDHREWSPVCYFGMMLGLMQAGCGATFAGDGRSFVCDNGTGLPISAIVCAAAVGLAVFYMTRL